MYHGKKIALFLDYENIHISLSDRYSFTLDVDKLVPLIRERINQWGTILIQKAYADWEDYPHVQSKLSREGIEPQYVLSKKISKEDKNGSVRVLSRKNSSDIAMALDIQQTLYDRQEMDLFILVTGDRDFIVPIRLLRSRQKEIVVFGVQVTTSKDLLGALPHEDHFISIESLLGIKAVQRVQTTNFNSPDFDWAPFISQMYRLEERLPFVALKYLRDTIVSESIGCGDTLQSKTKFLNVAIARKIIETGKAPNPAVPDTYTTTCKLNRNHALVAEVVS